MNLQISELHKACIDFMNKEHIRYLIDDEYLNEPKDDRQAEATDVLKVWFEYPRNQADQRLLNKLFKEFNHFEAKIKFRRSYPFGMDFPQAYYQRNVINEDGLTINFVKSASLTTNLSDKTSVLADLEGERFDHSQTIAELNFYNVEYLVIDQYPVAYPIGDYTQNDCMVLWLNPTRENATQVRKANKAVTGNPPSVNEMSRSNRCFLQGRTYWRTFYGDRVFSEAYHRRCTLNVNGQTVHFLHSDDFVEGDH